MSENFDNTDVNGSIEQLNTRSGRSVAKEYIKKLKESLKGDRAYIKKTTFFSRRTHNVLEKVLEDHIKGIPTPLPLLRNFYGKSYEDNSEFTYYDVMTYTLSKNDPYFIQQGRLSGFDPNKHHVRESPLARKIRQKDYASIIQLIHAGVDINEDINPVAEAKQSLYGSDSNVKSVSALRYALDTSLMGTHIDLSVVRTIALAGARDTPDSNMTTAKEVLLKRCAEQLSKSRRFFESQKTSEPQKLNVTDIQNMNELVNTLEVFKRSNLINKNDKQEFKILEEIVIEAKKQRKSLLDAAFFDSKNDIIDNYTSLTKRDINEEEYFKILAYFEKKQLNKDIQENALYEKMYELHKKSLDKDYEEKQKDAIILINRMPFLSEHNVDALENAPNYNGPAFQKMNTPTTFSVGGVNLDRYAFRIEALEPEMKHLLQSFYILTDGFTDTRGIEKERIDILEQLEKYPEMANLTPGELDKSYTKNKKVRQKWNEGHNGIVGLKRNETFGMMLMRSGDNQLIERVLRNASENITDLNTISTRGDSYLSILLEQENWNAIEYLFEVKDAQGKPAFNSSILMPPLSETLPQKTFIETLAMKYEMMRKDNPQKAEVYKKAIHKFNQYMHPSFQVELNDALFGSKLNTVETAHGINNALTDMHQGEMKLLMNASVVKPLNSFDIVDVKSTAEDVIQPYFRDVMQSLLQAQEDGTIESDKKIRQFVNHIFEESNLESGIHYSTRLMYELMNANVEMDDQGNPVHSTSNIKHKQAVAVALKVFMGSKEFSVQQLQESVNFNNTASLTYSDCLKHLGYSIMDIGYDIPGYSKEQLTQLSAALLEQNDTLSAVRSKLADEYTRKMDQDRGMTT